jgi:hypothetical protein
MSLNHLRPFIGEDGKSYQFSLDGKSIENSQVEAKLTESEWLAMDQIVRTKFHHYTPGIQKLIRRKLEFRINLSGPYPKLGIQRNEEGTVGYTFDSFPLNVTHWSCTREEIGDAAIYVSSALETTVLDSITKAAKHTADDVWQAAKLLERMHHYGPYLMLDLALNELHAVVQASQDCVRLVVGYYPTLVQWEDHFRIMAMVLLQARTDQNGKVGICLVRE